MHGGVKIDQLKEENNDAVYAGSANLIRHLENVSKFGVPTVVCINRFSNDTDSEISTLIEAIDKSGIKSKVILSNHWAEGGSGITDLAKEVIDLCGNADQDFKHLYELEEGIEHKITKIAKSVNLIIKDKNKIYGYNTDMSAFLKCIPRKFKNVLI